MPTTLKQQTVANTLTSDRRGFGVFDLLAGCHDDIRRQLDALTEIGNSLLSAGHFTRRHLACLCETLAFLDVRLPLHSQDEEDTLFPELCRLDAPGARLHLAMEGLRKDHRTHGVLELRLKIAVLRRDAHVAGNLALEIVQQTAEHLRQEEETLIPWAKSVLTDKALLDELAQEMVARHRDVGLVLGYRPPKS